MVQIDGELLTAEAVQGYWADPSADWQDET